ncbi:MAG TPA: hypothetical protein VEQ65_14055 [Opitutus sp.]|nr:hypothetical protein [Opitutus sp.]
MRSFVPGRMLVLAFAALAGALHGAALERDLGSGLRYFRAASLPADLPGAAAKVGPLVLDLRFSQTAEGGSSALEAWVRFRATARTPVLVLVNAETPAEITAVLAALKAQPGVLTVGSPTPTFAPDLALSIQPLEERRAYDALVHGSGSVQALITENADKPRVDEASIMRERSNPPPEQVPPDPLSTTTRPPEASPTPASPIDRTLQRAVHVHRALVALQRL